VEEVLVTGSLIHGVAAVGVPVTNLDFDDFSKAGAVTISDLLKNVPSVYVFSSGSTASTGGNQQRTSGVDIHYLNGVTPRTLMMIDGMRYPLQGHNTNFTDPSIIPAIAVEHVDVLADGASATYGSDAVAGVINVILKRGYQGAISQLRYAVMGGGGAQWQASQLWGRTWDGGDVTLAYEHFQQKTLKGPERSYYTYDFSPWGLDDRTPVRSSIPGVVSTGTPNAAAGTGCTNCYSVPSGQNGVGLTWAALVANAGVKNEVNPYFHADIQPPQQRNAATLTFDQDVLPGIRFYGEAFYSNRRVQQIYPNITTPYNSNAVIVAVPTSNPFYPAGAPSGLRVNYSFAEELPSRLSAYEVSARYQGGFRFELPYAWNGAVFFATNEEHNNASAGNVVNANNLSAAVGNTVPATGGMAAYTKPANVPYYNPFCDPTAFQCNSPATLAYIAGYRIYNQTYLLHQTGVNFDGPLFAVPAGEVRAAVGASYVTDNYLFLTTQNYNTASNALINQALDSQPRRVYALFGQLNAPLFGEANAVPLVRKLELEVSFRYDHYNDFGGTSNPKVALDWTPIDGLVLRGSWGTSFRAPAFGDISAVASKQIQPINIAAGDSTNSVGACTTVGGTPVPGSAAAVLNPGCLASLQFPAGITVRGGAGGLAGVTRPADYAIGPEKAHNWTVGFAFAPTGRLRGLDVNATYFSTDIQGAIASIDTTVGAALNDPSVRFAYMVAGDPGFAEAVDAIIRDPRSQVSASVQPFIRFINDGGSRNAGSLKQDGVDFNVSYDWDMAAYGVWSAGLSGTHFLHRKSVNVPGGTEIDAFDNGGQTQRFRTRYRARLGWEDGGWSITGFANYLSHYISTEALPSAAVRAPYPDFTANHVPSSYTFDVSAGYDLGDTPDSEYLKNISVQLVVNNLTDRAPPFLYKTSSNTGVTAYDGLNFNPFGRVISVSVTKTW
jgi:iron complex outermembrane receptor protein